jgi:signal transduction histidine kinase
LSCESHGTPWPLNEYVVRESLSIIAEAVTNIRKHARAQTVRIDIRFGLLACTVAVTDDGRGIPSEHLAGRLGHWGISGMHERAALIKARLRITSGAHGTTVCLRIPRWRVGLHQAQHE